MNQWHVSSRTQTMNFPQWMTFADFFLMRYQANQTQEDTYQRNQDGKTKNFKDRVIPDSLVLFRKKGSIVGQAISKTMIEELEPPEEGETETGVRATYYREIYFAPESIEVYSETLPIEQIESWANKKLDPRYYSIIGSRQAYEQRFGET